MFDSITDVPGVQVGHAHNLKALTGCSVLIFKDGAVGGVHIRGAATGSKELDVLNPNHIAEKIHGLLLAGGSAFGLDAASGVMKFLEERGVGFETGSARVPIVPAAIIYDLGVGDASVRPDAEMGYKACLEAKTGAIEQGSVGAGCGATVGKLYGMKRAMKGGLGTSSLTTPDGAVVGALAVVNAFGDVLDYESGRILAGLRDSEEGRALIGTAEQMRGGAIKEKFGAENTTLAVIATDAALTKSQASLAAMMAQDGLARSLSPLTLFDGDLIFAVSAGVKKVNLTMLGLYFADALGRAVRKAILFADGLGILPSHTDIFGKGTRVH